ncbi:YbhB/YbcL family Raf kinase inhibitor-like protein [Gynuella sunshinyii]|uniref:Phospholipid-binding protein n=1 Tax=Gynuella sunshinyii YC6258 TaxID=1445510 RepID=A0A0C5VHX2_9GAMM|nr:YbhB/YbcL family Raf kinase inhibitor-like protein [Gynuella sunshinyii]AJQ93861.1 phospholipid-binding protein [Gynuella sunshinyii YC6258]
MGFALSTMQLQSDAFDNGGKIPAKHTGEAENVSPSLSWKNSPDGTNGYAVICHDPDAPLISRGGSYGFVHWVLYNIPADVTHLEEATDQFTQGVHDAGNTGYTGPMPPNGHGLHHYYFWVIALKDAPKLPAGLTLWQLLDAVEPYAIGMNRLVGTYQRD